MKINYIARINPYAPQATGGGEAVMKELLEYGTNPGAYGEYVEKIEIITPGSEDKWMDDADISIFADVFNLPTIPGFDPDWLREKMAEKPYVHFNNAYVDICVHDYMACPNDEEDGICNRLGTEMMLGADLIYFVSPLHRDTVAERIPEILKRKTAVLRPTVDPDRFYNMELPERPIDYLLVAPLLKAKGFFNALDYLAEQEADPETCLIVGANPRNYPLGGIQHRTRVPYDELPQIMNQAKVFVHIPDWNEPMGRTVIEAALCGCNLAVNGKVGATSFGFEDIRDPDNYRDSADEFWTTVQKELGL